MQEIKILPGKGKFQGGDGMIYLLKFGASMVLPPGLFFICLWALAVYLWRRSKKQWERWIAAAVFGVSTVFYLMSTGYVSGMMMSKLENVYDQPAEPQGDVIVMLGGGVTADTPNQGGWGNLHAIPAGRLLTTAELYHRLHLPVLVSGGGRPYEDSCLESVVARRDLVRLGVPENMILMENQSLNTRQNAIYSGKIMAEQALVHPILVTSAFHMERAVLNFQKEGFEVTAFPTDYRCNRQQIFHLNQLMPQTQALDDSVTVLREKLRLAVTRYLE